MTAPVDIVLTKLSLWYDATRVQTWPAFLASIPADAIEPSPTHFGRVYATTRMTSTRHSSASNLVRNLPGLEKRGSKLHLRGVGLLERGDKGYCVSPLGRHIAQLYVDEPGSQEWVVALGDALLGREPRTRALIGLLSQRDANLEFPEDDWFGGAYRKARLSRPGEDDIYPFADEGDRVDLGQTLAERAVWCLGDWSEHEAMGSAEPVRFVGARSSTPSLHRIGLALRASMEVFHVLGVVKESKGSAWLDSTTAARILPTRANEFGWVAATDESLVATLTEVLPTLRTPTGHVVASELRGVLQDRGHSDPDRAIAEAEEQGQVLVYAEDYGQSRHGRGLYGDPRKQLVKLRIVGTGAAK